MNLLSRRRFTAGLFLSGAALPPAGSLQSVAQAANSSASTFPEVVRQPDVVTAFFTLNSPQEMKRSSAAWEVGGALLETRPSSGGIEIHLSTQRSCPTHIHLRWQQKVSTGLLAAGDAWERSYGDQRWEHMVPERVMPWYFLASDGKRLHGYGVKTGAGAFCFWQLDPEGVSLWLDLQNGGSPADLGQRTLLAATVVSYGSSAGEDAMSAATAFCRRMCDVPRVPQFPVYGSNDWYYAYGENTREQIIRDAELVASLSPAKGARPFTVIDDGWQKFPDMAGLAQTIRSHGVRPGIWIRPLRAPDDAAQNLLLPAEGHYAKTRAYDPTIPEALNAVLSSVKDAVSWKYDLIKHDYTTFELFGQWGKFMGPSPSLPGWSFHDRTKTNAEIVRDLYQSIRKAAGESTLVIGCNTIGHLAAGIFDIQRTGDDVSGRIWERTRRMGVNTLAYRLPQHKTFFFLDADCVPITKETPWNESRQWLDLIARSGTTLFISAAPEAIGPEQRSAIREAFEIVQSAHGEVRAADWQTSSTPQQWKFGSVEKNYNWFGDAGAWPFEI